MEYQENLHPNNTNFDNHREVSNQKLSQRMELNDSNQKLNFSDGKKSPELVQMIRNNINYQHDQTIQKTLMKESMMKFSLEKDFNDLFNCAGKTQLFKESDNQSEEKSQNNLMEVSQQIRDVFEWLEESQQYAGMSYLPLTSYTKFFHILHQKLDSVAIIVTEYPIYYLSKMQNLTRLSKLKWAFLNASLEPEDKVKILEMYELKKLKLLFVSPTIFKSQLWHEFQSQILVITDFQQYRQQTDFVNSIIARTKPGRVLGVYPTLMKQSMTQHQKNNFHYINRPNSDKFNYIVLKCQRDQKQKSIINYLNKNINCIQRTLVLINKRTEACSLTKKMTMDSKNTVNMFDYVNTCDLFAFNPPELLNRFDKIKEQEKILEALKKMKHAEVVISSYSDILKFEQFDLVVFFSFTDVKKYVECCPNVKNKLLLFDEDDYHNFRNSITSQYLNYEHLHKQIIKIIEKPQKKQAQNKKRFYSDYIDDKLLNKYSVAKNIVQKDEEKSLKINTFCRTNNLSHKNFHRIIDALVEIGMISINCKVIYELEIEEGSLSWFRKTFPQITQIRRKVNLLNSSSVVQKTTQTLLEEFKKENIKFKVLEEALQFKVLKNYEDINWNDMQRIVNKKLMDTVKAFDESLDIFKQCAYGSIELTRRQKVLQRKQVLLKFSIKDMTAQEQQSTTLVLQDVSNGINESYHKSNLLTSEIEEYLRTSQEGITDEHQLVMLLQGVERTKTAKEKEEWIFGRYRKMKYQDLIEAVGKIFKNKKMKF